MSYRNRYGKNPYGRTYGGKRKHGKLETFAFNLGVVETASKGSTIETANLKGIQFALDKQNPEARKKYY